MKSAAVILTIAIPTYNRAAKLQAQLERLVPQLTAETQVRVFDNASPDNTREVVAKYPNILYSRSTTNCGASRNIFRCFEECVTEWVWVLCDDDLVTASAVGDLLAILRHESADLLHFSSRYARYLQDSTCSDIPTLFQQAKVGSLLWMTGSIYRMSSFQPLFRLYNEAFSTWAAHMVMILALVESGKGKVHLTPIELAVPAAGMAHWSVLDGMLRFSLAPEYLSRPVNQRLLAERLLIEFFNDYMLMALRDTGDDQHTRKWQRVYAQVNQNLKAYGSGSVMGYVIKNGCRKGYRKQCLLLTQQLVSARLLSWCPAGLFHGLARVLPLSKDIREACYNRRHEYTPFC